MTERSRSIDEVVAEVNEMAGTDFPADSLGWGLTLMAEGIGLRGEDRTALALTDLGYGTHDEVGDYVKEALHAFMTEPYPGTPQAFAEIILATLECGIILEKRRMRAELEDLQGALSE